MSVTVKEGSPAGQTPRAAIDGLLSEVKALAIQTKKSMALMHRPDGLPARGWEVMRTLATHGPSTVPQISRQVLTSRQNVQMTVNWLKGEGWVEVGENANHKRSGMVSLTERGRSVVLAAGQREERFWAGLCAEETVGQAQVAAALLHKLRSALAGRTGDGGGTASAPLPAPLKVAKKEPLVEVVQPALEEDSLGEHELPVNLL